MERKLEPTIADTSFMPLKEGELLFKQALAFRRQDWVSSSCPKCMSLV